MQDFYTESFEEFASRLGPTDLALYAGAGLVLWILFKDKLSPVQNFLLGLTKKIRSKNLLVSETKTSKPIIEQLVDSKDMVTISDDQDIFFQLITSWKQTRDLAVKSECKKAVEIADQMFQFLSPSVCEDNNE